MCCALNNAKHTSSSCDIMRTCLFLFVAFLPLGYPMEEVSEF